HLSVVLSAYCLRLYRWLSSSLFSASFFLTGPATPEIYTLSLHDALPILVQSDGLAVPFQGLGAGRKNVRVVGMPGDVSQHLRVVDRKSTRLNSSHVKISYAVFCLKKKKNTTKAPRRAAPRTSAQPLAQSP